MLHLRCSVLLSVLVLACGSQTTSSTDTDAGSFFHPDGGTHHDGGTVDAGHTGADAGIDAGMQEPDAGTEPDAGSTTNGPALKTVFLILMENHNWSTIKGSSSAPYINSLLAKGASAEAYYNPPGLHPSEPNYIWLEAGDNFGIAHDSTKTSTDSQSTTAHLVTQLEAAGVSWKEYAEDMPSGQCPLSTSGNYAPKHVPMVWFEDVTNSNSTSSSRCIAHVRPYTEFAGDLTNNTVARYNFITPNLCDDMHAGCGTIAIGDTWLSKELPKILASKAYLDGGVVFVTWDESEGGDFPIGMIALSPYAKQGYSNKIAYTHSSTLRTNQEIFGVSPFLGDAANATDLSDLFTKFP